MLISHSGVSVQLKTNKQINNKQTQQTSFLSPVRKYMRNKYGSFKLNAYFSLISNHIRWPTSCCQPIPDYDLDVEFIVSLLTELRKPTCYFTTHMPSSPPSDVMVCFIIGKKKIKDTLYILF